MNAFLDTSALLKLYHLEPFSGELWDFLYAGMQSQIILSQIAPIELTSAIRKKQRSGTLKKKKADTLLQDFHLADLFQYELIPFEEDDVQNAIRLVNESSLLGGSLQKLVTLDAIQLTAALKSRDYIDVFISFDKVLTGLAAHYGLQTKTWPE